MNTLSVSLNEAVTAIKTIGVTNTILLRGQPGIGKSAILKILARDMPDYHAVYVDVATLDIGDLGMPVIDHENRVTHFAPSSRFGIRTDLLNGGRPLIVMLDELGKASSKAVLNSLLPLVHEHRLVTEYLPAGSIVIATTNLDTDGVGDIIPAHAYDRMTVCIMRNPTPDEWLVWAGGNDIAPEVQAFAKQFPSIFQCYTELAEKQKNPHIYNPLTGNTQNYCTPRGLANASNIVKARAVLGNAYLPLLAGTIGASAARDLDAIVSMADEIPMFDRMVSEPDKCPIPKSAGALFVMSFMLVGRVTAETMDAVMTYVNRIKAVSFEAHSLFVMTLATNESKVGMACRNREFTKACAELGKYF
tara:strand:+ start:46 stop:1128 length:1083 start_codon:yes stop_codon:yes gene_type:complete